MSTWPCLRPPPIFEWCLSSCTSKNIHQKDTCLQKIELNVRNVLTILDLIVDVIGGPYVTIQWARESSLWQQMRYSNELCKLWWKVATATIWNCKLCRTNHDVSRPRRRMMRRMIFGKSDHLRPIYLSTLKHVKGRSLCCTTLRIDPRS